MLENQRQTQKIRRQVTGRGLGHEVNVYVPLGLVKPKVAPRREQDGSPSAEQGMQQYQLTEKEVEQQYEHDEFLKQVIEGQDKNLAIIGEPGAGKSTWLEQIALYVDKSENSFPICIPLGNLGEKTLEDYLLQIWLKDAEQFLPSSRSPQPPFLRGVSNLESGVSSEAIELEELFKRGKVWLLLDGVDEMRLQRAESPLQKIANHLTGWVASVRVVLTCRLNVWEANSNSLTHFDTYRTLIFDDEQVGDFIGQWFAKAGEAKLGEQLKDKLGESGRERIRDLIKNPLRLALLCKTWATKQGELPKTKAALYQRFRDDFYKWKESEFPTERKQRQELNAALGRLALAAIQDKLPLRETVAYEQMGESCFDLARSLGWLNWVYQDAETDEPVYAFFHLTFQEYFAACAIDDWHFFLNHLAPPLVLPYQGGEQNKALLSKGRESIKAPLFNRGWGDRTYRIFEPQWREVILLWLGREDVEKEQKKQFIQALIEFEDGCKGFYKYRAYFLAVAGIVEVGDTPLADKIAAQIVIFQNEYTRRDAAQSLGEIGAGNPTAIEALVNLIQTSQDKFTRWQAAESLGKIDPGNPTAIEALVKLIQTSQGKFTRRKAAESLGKIDPGNPTAIEALVKLIQTSQDEDTRRDAVESLGEIGAGNPTAIEALVNLIQTSQDEYTSREVAESLEKIGAGNPTAIEALVKLIQTSQDKYTRRQAAESLGKIGAGNPTVIEALVKLIQTSQDEYTRWKAAQSLEKIDPGNPTVIEALVKLIQTSQDKFTRWQAAQSLGQIGAGNPTAIEALVNLIQTSQDESTRREVAESLEKSGAGNPTTIEALVNLIQTSQDEYTRRDAVDSLEKIGAGNPTAIDALVKLIQTSQDEYTRWQAADSLKKILEEAQMAEVVSALRDYLSKWTFIINPERYHDCYNLLWHCAQTLPYPDFYQAWHQQQEIKLPKLLRAAIKRLGFKR